MHAAPVHEQDRFPHGGGSVARALIMRERPEVVGAVGAVPVRVGVREVAPQLLIPSHLAQRGEIRGLA